MLNVVGGEFGFQEGRGGKTGVSRKGAFFLGSAGDWAGRTIRPGTKNQRRERRGGNSPTRAERGGGV